MSGRKNRRKSDDRNMELLQAHGSFVSQLCEAGFTQDTALCLLASGFTSMDLFKLLGDNISAIRDMEINVAQRLLLQKFLCVGNKEGSKSGKKDSKQTGGTLAEILHEITYDNGGDLHIVHQAQQACTEPRSLKVNHLATQDQEHCLRERGECEITPLDIDFVNLVPSLSEEQVLRSDGGVELVIKGSTRRPKLEHIAIEDWCIANTRIMDSLLSSGSLDTVGLHDYNAYTVKVCVMFRVFERTSVLQYDREYRHLQARNGFRWGVDVPHLFQVHLVRKVSVRPKEKFQKSSKRPIKTVSSDRIEICRLYNSVKGCHFRPRCRFRHVWSEPGCEKLHSFIDHASTTDTSERL